MSTKDTLDELIIKIKSLQHLADSCECSCSDDMHWDNYDDDVEYNGNQCGEACSDPKRYGEHSGYCSVYIAHELSEMIK
ncbi:MAG: hypothetical protein QM504_08080 [Pseudomonadota bacterium]